MFASEFFYLRLTESARTHKYANSKLLDENSIEQRQHPTNFAKITHVKKIIHETIASCVLWPSFIFSYEWPKDFVNPPDSHTCTLEVRSTTAWQYMCVKYQSSRCLFYLFSSIKGLFRINYYYYYYYIIIIIIINYYGKFWYTKIFSAV